MGSSSSAPVPPPPTSSDVSKPKKPTNLSGMPLVNYVCRQKKKRYDDCVAGWYKGEFLQSKSLEQPCDDLFEIYRTCMLKGIRKEVWDKQGLGDPGENSPLSEIDEEE